MDSVCSWLHFVGRFNLWFLVAGCSFVFFSSWFVADGKVHRYCWFDFRYRGSFISEVLILIGIITSSWSIFSYSMLCQVRKVYRFQSNHSGILHKTSSWYWCWYFPCPRVSPFLFISRIMMIVSWFLDCFSNYHFSLFLKYLYFLKHCRDDTSRSSCCQHYFYFQVSWYSWWWNRITVLHDAILHSCYNVHFYYRLFVIGAIISILLRFGAY